jgi:hypothetical protein
VCNSNWNGRRTKRRWSTSTNTSCAAPSIPRISVAMWRPFSSIDRTTPFFWLEPRAYIVPSSWCTYIGFLFLLYATEIRMRGTCIRIYVPRRAGLFHFYRAVPLLLLLRSSCHVIRLAFFRRLNETRLSLAPLLSYIDFFLEDIY